MFLIPTTKECKYSTILIPQLISNPVIALVINRDFSNFQVKTKVMEDLKAELYSKTDINKESVRIRNELMADKPLLEYVEKSIKWLEQNQNSTFISRLEPLENVIYLK